MQPEYLVGAGLLVAGLVLRFWAAWTFHKEGIEGWELVREPDRWVDTGPYRYMQHPLYRAGLLMTAGTGLLLFGHWGGVLFAWPWWTFYRERELQENAYRARAALYTEQKREFLDAQRTSGEELQAYSQRAFGG